MATALVERRLSVILAADVVGYSRLMERDEVRTFERLKRLRKELIEPVLEQYGGRFIDLKGHGAIVEFGSVISTVEAAVEIQGRCWPRIPICLRASASATGSGSTSAT
jgi:adenylate cyclase